MADSQILSELVDVAVDTYQEGLDSPNKTELKQNVIKKAIQKAQESGMSEEEIVNIEKTLQDTLNNNPENMDKEAFKAQLSQKVFESVNVTVDTQTTTQNDAANSEVLQDLVDTAVNTLQESNQGSTTQSKDAIVEATIQKAVQNGIDTADLGKIEEGVRKVLDAYDSSDTTNENFSIDTLRTSLSQELSPVIQNSTISFSNTIDQNNNGNEQDLTTINNEIEQFNSVMQNNPKPINNVVFNTELNTLNLDTNIDTIQIQEKPKNNIEDVVISNINIEEVIIQESIPESELVILEPIPKPELTITNPVTSSRPAPDTTAPIAPTISLTTDSGTSDSDGITNINTVTVSGLESSASWQYSIDNGTTWNDGTSNTFTLDEGTYNIGTIKVKQTDSAGNTSTQGSNTLAFVIDSTENTNAPTVVTDTLENAVNTNAVVQGPETGKAYLINTDNTPTNVSEITSLDDNQYNAVEITSANTDTNLPTVGLAVGTYKVYFADAAGNLTTTPSTNSVTVVADTTAPDAPTLAIAEDTGSSDSDNITSNTTVNVSGVENQATWEYSMDGGSTWNDGTGTSFTLDDATYNANDIQVRQTDLAGNLSTTVGKISSEVTIDTNAPSATVTTATLLPTDNAVVKSTEIGTAYLVLATQSISSLNDITSLADNKYNSVSITSVNTDTNLAATGLGSGEYKVYTVDKAGNLSDASTDTITVTAPAVITNVSSSTTNGTYKEGDTIDITVTFDDSVTVTGTPQITLETGDTDRTIDYVSGSGTDTLTFTYTVQAGDNNSDLDFTDTSALTLNSGTIKGTNTLDATLTLPTLGGGNSIADNKDIVVDALAPTVSSVALTSDNESTYSVLNAGDVVTATVTMSEAVTVTGTPTITLIIDSTEVQASYDAENSTTTQLKFNYTILDSQTDTDGISIKVDSLTAGTSIQDLAGNDATLTFSAVTDNADYKVDTTLPVINSVVFDDTALKVGDTATVTITFSEAVTDFANADITLTNGTLSDVSSSDGGIIWTATFTPTDDIEDATNIITVGTTLADLAGNTPASSVDSANYEIDTKEPTATVALDKSALKVGETATLTITFSDAPTNFVEGDDVTVDNGALSGGSFDETGLIYTATYTPTDDIEDTSNIVTLGTSWSDTAGNAPVSSSSSSNISLDTKEPTVATTSPISKSDVDNSNDYTENDTITIKFSEAVDATKVTIANITVSNSHTLGSSTISPVTGYSDTFVITLSSDATILPDDTLTISNSNIVDEAGNSITSDAVFTLPAFIPTVSSVALSATGASNSTLNAGDTVTATVTMSSAVDVTGTPQVALNIGGSTVQASYSSGTGTDTLTFTYTILAAQTDTNGISVDANSLALNSGTIKIKDGTVAANLEHTALSDDSDFKVDTTAPTANFTAATDDVGTVKGTLSSGDKTDDTSLVLSGTCEAGSTVEVFNGTSSLGSATIDGTSWTYTATVADATTYNFNVKETDAAGNESSATSNFTVIGDTTVPTLSSSSPADDGTGAALGGNITLTFDEAVSKGTGNITLYDVTGSTAVATYDVSSASEITGWGTTTLTINPASDLTASNNYAVKVDSTAVTDSAGNAYAGISDNTTLNFQTGTGVDTTKVVFDLVGGTSSSHSSRTFDASTSYTIYIRVDSDSKTLFTDANSSSGTWGTWSGAANLGSDDKIVLVGDGVTNMWNTKNVIGAKGAIVTKGNISAGVIYNWGTSSGFKAAKILYNGKFSRFVSDNGSNGNTVDLWSGNWASIGNSAQQPIQSSIYKTTMPAGVMTSQGLA